MKISLTPEQARDLPYPLGCKFLCLLLFRRKILDIFLQLQCWCTSCVLLSLGAWRYMYCDHCNGSVGISYTCVISRLLLHLCYIVVWCCFMIHLIIISTLHLVCTSCVFFISSFATSLYIVV